MAVARIKEEIPLNLNADGVYLVGGTRVTLDTVIRAYKRGVTAERIAQQYTAVDLADIYSVIGYYLHNQETIETYLRQREDAIKEARKFNDARSSQKGIRARLLARTQKRKV